MEYIKEFTKVEVLVKSEAHAVGRIVVWRYTNI